MHIDTISNWKIYFIEKRQCDLLQRQRNSKKKKSKQTKNTSTPVKETWKGLLHHLILFYWHSNNQPKAALECLSFHWQDHRAIPVGKKETTVEYMSIPEFIVSKYQMESIRISPRRLTSITSNYTIPYSFLLEEKDIKSITEKNIII